ncbi:poly-gamma-glutamate synthase PgsB [Alteribacter natronophilus]|uniref:poly-gamma-glutamate synthase PgsB n=1 Tax=Alteribacter natronophilus TaxID=2583810 RepID=UPI00110F322F|nr:poly-gamma-glutamate synthase PgsB [Alteribacter natronophilus]TMW72198.1 poly-gamma-glutamate synthase PgsB [Alteribacter natronophilus]
MLLIPLSFVLLFTLGILERKRHQRNVESIPNRININGVRGKSTVTRLITGIMMEAGFKTVGKTTGTQARMIYSDREDPIIRDPEGPNIKEQLKVMKSVSDDKIEVLVSECMAVNPDYQKVFQNIMLQANIGVIVNVLEDHMDVLGPTIDDVAQSFTATIPYNGHLIVNDGPYKDYFRKIAEERNTEMIVADTSTVTEDYLRKFEYMMFPDNAALPLAVAQAMGIDRETALKGMLNAPPDPGAMKILKTGNPESPSYFFNGFAANDASSTLNIWKRVKELGFPSEHPIVIMNCRKDRVDRSEQFARDVLPNLDIGTLVVIGDLTSPIEQAYRDGTIEAEEFINLEGRGTEEIYDALHEKMNRSSVFGVGNIHGAAEPLVERIQKEHNEKHESEEAET